ncbi:unnamed protein product [Calypogeia fissa]
MEYALTMPDQVAGPDEHFAVFLPNLRWWRAQKGSREGRNCNGTGPYLTHPPQQLLGTLGLLRCLVWTAVATSELRLPYHIPIGTERAESRSGFRKAFDSSEGVCCLCLGCFTNGVASRNRCRNRSSLACARAVSGCGDLSILNY